MLFRTIGVAVALHVSELRGSEGDTSAAFADLYRQHAHRVRGLIRRRVADPDLVEDLVQEVFLRAYRSYDEFDSGRAAWPWLATIAANLCVDALRGAARRPKLDDRDVADADIAAPVSWGDPAESLVDKERRVGIADALSELSDRHRRMVLLRDVEGWRYDEIAKYEGVPVPVLKSALLRARRRFQQAYSSLAEQRGLWGGLPLAPGLAGRRIRARLIRWARVGTQCSEWTGAVSVDALAAIMAAAAISVAGVIAAEPATGPRAAAASTAVRSADPIDDTHGAASGGAVEPPGRTAEVERMARSGGPGVGASVPAGKAGVDGSASIERTDDNWVNLTGKVVAKLPNGEMLGDTQWVEFRCSNEVREVACDAVDAIPDTTETEER